MSDYRHRVYGWKPYELSKHLTVSQLIELDEDVRHDPRSANPEHAAGRSIYIYTRAARKRMEAIGWAITHHIQRRRTEPMQLEYKLTKDGWVWSGPWAADPSKGDDAAKAMMNAWNRLAATAKGKKLNPVGFRYADPNILEVLVPEPNVYELIDTFQPMGIYIISAGTTPGYGPSDEPTETVAPKPLRKRAPKPPKAPPDPTRSAFGAFELAGAIKRLELSAISLKPKLENAPKLRLLGNAELSLDADKIVLVSTDGTALTLIRIPGVSHLVRNYTGPVIIPMKALVDLLPVLKKKDTVSIDLGGDSSVFDYHYCPGVPGVGPEKAKAGLVYIDGAPVSVPLIQADFIKWNHVLPMIEWTVYTNSTALRAICADYVKFWRATWKAKGFRRSLNDALFSVRVTIERNVMLFDCPPSYFEDKSLSWSGRIATDGLSRKAPVRFCINADRMRDLLEHVSGQVRLGGTLNEYKGSDGLGYVVSPIEFTEFPGPMVYLLMPIYPDRS